MLKKDTRAIFTAAAAASTAVDYLNKLQPAEPEPTPEPPAAGAMQGPRDEPPGGVT